MLDYSQLTKAEYISSLPALIEEHPGFASDDLENAMVVAILHRDTQRLASLVLAPLSVDPETVARTIANGFTSGNYSVVITVVADDEHTLYVQAAADILAAGLGETDMPVLSRTHTAEIVAGGTWRDLDTGETGTLPDPASSPVAIARLVDGRGPIPDRDELDLLFVPIEAADTAAAEAECRKDPRTFHRETLGQLREIVALFSEADNDNDRAHALGRTESELAARIGAMVDDSATARDAMLGVALIDIPGAIEVYTRIANQLTGIVRSHTLATIAILYYVDGRSYHGHEAVHQAIHAAMAEYQFPPVTVRALMAAHNADLETVTARNYLALGPMAARAFGIDAPDFNPYTTE